eukprot:Gregarina_sp_Pseudo_9__4751@NODE_495_length_2711_cov_157_190494_g467_i0_p1_GENE_NODE_495_length_2711_cov_157_190494_g467_i0NODE_495_length_2711_cov_157_190494_g467_i0_p1_ORF_typecomplete_len596_score114_90Endotoxin_N/PF03945_14/0_018_NODE_495_length_2711_cov_157_190494_g467_i0481835
MKVFNVCALILSSHAVRGSSVQPSHGSRVLDRYVPGARIGISGVSTGVASASTAVNANAVELSRRVCAQYATSPNFCDSLASAVAEATDHRSLMRIPAKLSVKTQYRDASVAGGMLKGLAGNSTLHSPFPQHLDVHPQSSWKVRSAVPLPDSANGLVIMDTILSIVDAKFSSLNSGADLVVSTFFGEETDLFEGLIAYLEDWVLEEVTETVWTGIREVIGEFKTKLVSLKTAVSSDSNAVVEQFKDLMQFSTGKEQVFQPSGSSATFFPLYVAWSSMMITLYRALLCDTARFGKLSAADAKAIKDANYQLIDDFVEYGASVETAYNAWFLENAKYKWASEIQNHYVLRFGFDYVLGIGNSRDRCDFTQTEKMVPSSFSAIPLFGEFLVDVADDARTTMVRQFFEASMSYQLPKKQLLQLMAGYYLWDQAAAVGLRMDYTDGTQEKYGTFEANWLSGWDLNQYDEMCKVRGMRYEYGDIIYENQARLCENEAQWYRYKTCSNKFKADIECSYWQGEWSIGKDFGDTPNVVIPGLKTRIFSKFIGWGAQSHEAEISQCLYADQYAILNGPTGHEHLLDNLLAVYRIDSVDYSAQVPA